MEVFRDLGQKINNNEENIETISNNLKKIDNGLCPIDRRIQEFINVFLDNENNSVPKLPQTSFVMEQYGLSKKLSSYPLENIEKSVDSINSFGVFKNYSDESNEDVISKDLFSNFLYRAFNPPKKINRLTFSSLGDEYNKETMVSLLLRPIVTTQRSMETRVFAPACLVDLMGDIETEFGNGGNPYNFENDSALNPKNWTGHTGCIVFAPHLNNLEYNNEVFNNGNPFSVTAKSENGVSITIVACNNSDIGIKEIKKHISFSNNKLGIYPVESKTFFEALSSEEEYNWDNIFLNYLFKENNLVDNLKEIPNDFKIIAQKYVSNNKVENLCLPLKTLLYIITSGSYKGLTLDCKELKDLFNIKQIVGSKWYTSWINAIQRNTVEYYEFCQKYILSFLKKNICNDINLLTKIQKEFLETGSSLYYYKSSEYKRNLMRA